MLGYQEAGDAGADDKDVGKLFAFFAIESKVY